jgi:hypothetical protein
VGLDDRSLAADVAHRFQVRAALGTPAPVGPPPGPRELAAGIRRAAGLLAGRAEAVAAVADRLGARGWWPLHEAPGGRDVLATHGFALPDGATLPASVVLVREATAAQVAADLAEAGGSLAGELEAGLTVRVEGLDIPVRVGPGLAELRYSPREYLETFPTPT